jgi:zinc protease
MTDIHWTNVDGVTTVWTDAPEPLRAGLLFRTGRVDETIATSGLTHLIEHIALASTGDDSQINGVVAGQFTGFFTMGRPEYVTEFFSKLCEALVSLPGDRLDSEKQVLAAESATRRYDLRSNLLAWRYGASGYGLIEMPEIGLKKAALEQIKNFASQRFTCENAVLWLSGPLPDGLTLKLSHGTKVPIPPLTTIQHTYPGWFLDERVGGIAVGFVVPRVSAAPFFCEIASARLRKRLRMDKAISYGPTIFYDPLNADVAHLVLYADSENKNRVELTTLFGEIIDELKDIDDAEMEAARDQILERYIGSLAPPLPDLKVMEVVRASMDWIMGVDFEPIETLVDQYKLVTKAEVAKFVSNMASTGIFALPPEVPLFPCFGKKIPGSPEILVTGPWAVNLDAPIRQEKLVYGPDGVSFIWPNGSHTTVLYSALAAVLCYEDGGLRLIGKDAAHIMIEPTLWRDGKEICRAICQQVPADLLIEQPARLENAIPKATTTAWQRFRARLNQNLNLADGKRHPVRFNKSITWLYILTLAACLLLVILVSVLDK